MPVQRIELDVGELPVGGRRVELVDVFGDPEAQLAVEQLRAALGRQRLEGGFIELGDRRVEVADDRLEPLRVPFGPVALPDPVRGAVAVGDEAAVGQLAGALLLRSAGRLGEPLNDPRSSYSSGRSRSACFFTSRADL
jgi:hypothetical protein